MAMEPMAEYIETVEEYIEEVGHISVGPSNLQGFATAFLILFVCYFIIHILTLILHKGLRQIKTLDATSRHFLEAAVKLLLWVMAIIIVTDMIGISTTSLVAGFGVVGLALSLSVQSILSNVFSGITLLVTKPFRAGNFVDIAGKTGTVRRVGLFYTVLETLDHLRVSIPNADVTAAAVTNYSSEPARRVDLTYSASYDTPTETVKAALLDAIAGDERILPEPAPRVAIQAFKNSSIDYAVRLWCLPQDYWDVSFTMNDRVRESFQKHGAEMSYDHLNVHIVDRPKGD